MIVIVKRTLIVQRVVLHVKGYLQCKGKHARKFVIIQIARLDTVVLRRKKIPLLIALKHNEVVSARTGIIFLYYYKKNELHDLYISLHHDDNSGLLAP